MKKPLILLLAILCFYLFAPAAYAQQVTYRDARIFGKVVTQDIVYGSLFYRDNAGNYITHATRTYFRVDPLHERHYTQLTNNVDGTVVLLGKMQTSGTYTNQVFIYHEVKLVDFEIRLEDKYYFSFLRSYQQAYGIELKNGEAMGDLLKSIGELSNWDSEVAVNQNIRKFLFDYRKDNLSYQWLLGKDEQVGSHIRNHLNSAVFINGLHGSNTLVQKAEVGSSDIKIFMGKSVIGTKDPVYEEAPMTIYGKFSRISLGFGNFEYRFTGVAGYTLEHWLDNFTAEQLNNETWKLKNNPGIDENIFIWATGYRWEETDEEGQRTGRWYFTPTYWINNNSFVKGLDNYSKLTSGELVI